MHTPEELHAALGLFEGEISIYEKETEKGTGKYLKIKKMSNHKHLENELQLKKPIELILHAMRWKNRILEKQLRCQCIMRGHPLR